MNIINTDMLKFPLQKNMLVNHSHYSLIEKLYLGLRDVNLAMDYLSSLPHTLSLNLLPIPKGSLSVLAPNRRM